MDICRRDKIEKISSDKLQAQLKIQYENFEDTPNQSRIEFLETLINNYNKELRALRQDIRGWVLDTQIDSLFKDKKVLDEPSFSGPEDYWYLENYEDELIRKAKWHINNGGPMNNNFKYDAFVIGIDRIHDDGSREHLSTLTVGDMWDEPNWERGA